MSAKHRRIAVCEVQNALGILVWTVQSILENNIKCIRWLPNWCLPAE
jgi:hypothetical protein